MSRLPALTIRTRIILASTIVFGVALVAFTMVIYHSSKRAEFAKLEARLESHSEKLQTEIEEQVQGGAFPDIGDLNAIKTEGLSHVLRQLIDSSGHVTFSDSSLSNVRELFTADAIVREPAFGRIRVAGHRYLAYWAPVEVAERNQFVLILAAPLAEVEENLAGMRLMFYVTIPVTLLLAAVAIFLITQRALRPLNSMTETARRISASNLSHRLDLPPAQDEVRLFAETINSMLQRIEAAFQSQKQFVADASHEIRTPLTVLNSELEYARKRVTDGEAKASIEASLAEIDRLSQMVEGLLLLTRIDAHRVAATGKRYRLDEIVIEIIQSLRRLADSKNIVLKPFVQDAVELEGNGELIRRALLNTIENAVKYGLSGTEVSVTLEISAGAAASVKVQDNGPGISEADQKRIFERFFRGENARAETEGSGLGLAIAKELLELHGGTISLQSEIGRGTTVCIRLPLNAPA
jgi:heavy metal sensor kinase